MGGITPKCSVCKEQDFDFILFRPTDAESYHYHSHWNFDKRRVTIDNSLFGGKNKEEVLNIINAMNPNMEILGLFCQKCAQKGITKYEFFRKFKGDKPYCYFCNKTIYKIKGEKHPMAVGFNAIQKQNIDNMIEMRSFHKDRVLYD